MKIRSIGSAGLTGALLVVLTGCTTYVERPVHRTVYVTPTPVEPPPPPPPTVVYTPAPAPAPVVVVIQTENDFYEPLTPYGEWVVVGSYGRCWRPAHVDAAWRPYANGYWRRTDAGWYWASDEPWGWATYHYGRWDWTAQFGWIWVPRTEWAPAWVSWREGAGYVGWAPLPPAARISVSGTVEIGDAVIAPRFVFVEERRLLEPVRPTTVIVNNTTVINKTVNITKIKVVNKTVVNEGPRADAVERASGRRIETVPAHELRHREETEVVARRRNNPPVGGNRTVQPATDSVRSTAVPPRNNRVADRPVDTVRDIPVTAAPDTTVREPRRQNPTVERDRPEVRDATRIERKPEPPTVAVKPEPMIKPIDTIKKTPPAPVGTTVREVGQPNPPGRRERPEVRGTGRDERKVEVNPIVARPEPKPEAKPEPRRESPARNVRTIERTPSTQTPAQAATPQVGAEPPRAVGPRNVRENERVNRPATTRMEGAPRASSQVANTPAAGRVKSPKAAAAAEEQGAAKKDQKKKGDPADKVDSPRSNR